MRASGSVNTKSSLEGEGYFTQMRQIGHEWKELSAEEQNAYKKQHQEMNKKWKLQMIEYKKACVDAKKTFYIKLVGLHF